MKSQACTHVCMHAGTHAHLTKASVVVVKSLLGTDNVPLATATASSTGTAMIWSLVGNLL